MKESVMVDLGTHVLSAIDRHDAIDIECNKLAELGSTSPKKFKRALVVIRKI